MWPIGLGEAGRAPVRPPFTRAVQWGVFVSALGQAGVIPPAPLPPEDWSAGALAAAPVAETVGGETAAPATPDGAVVIKSELVTSSRSRRCQVGRMTVPRCCNEAVGRNARTVQRPGSSTQVGGA